MFKLISKNNKDLTALFILIICFIAGQIFNVLSVDEFNLGFGAEYHQIAQSILAGEGFSNPFPIPSGPTVWGLPTIPFILAISFFIFKHALATFIFLSIIKLITLCISFYLILKTIEICKLKKYTFIFLGVFLLYIFFSPSEFFRRISNLWIIIFVVSVFIYSLMQFYYHGIKKGYFLLLIACFFLPMINPGFALASGFSILFIFCIDVYKIFKDSSKTYFTDNNSELKYNKNSALLILLRNYTVIFIAFALSVSIWTVRNYIVFEKFIPSKSNMWFEFYMANVSDRDGQLSVSTVYREHPYENETINREVQELGEIEWVRKYEIKSKRFLESNFNEYLSKIQYRFKNAFFYIESDEDVMPSVKFDKFNNADKIKLIDHKLLVKRVDHWGWTCLYLDKLEMSELLKELTINDQTIIISDWEAAKSSYHTKNYSKPYIFRSLFITIIPLLCIFIILFIKQKRRNPLFFVTVIMYSFYLIPYILISHQMRYQRPLFILQIILIYLFISILIEKSSPYLNETFKKIISKV